MEKKIFETQLRRMKETWGERHYPAERGGILWRAFQNVYDDDFEEAVDQLIANSRMAPMLDGLAKAVDEAKVRRNQRNLRSGIGIPGFGKLLEEASTKTSANSEFVKACLKLLQDKIGKNLNKTQFLQGCDYLDTVARQLNEGANDNSRNN